MWSAKIIHTDLGEHATYGVFHDITHVTQQKQLSYLLLGGRERQKFMI